MLQSARGLRRFAVVASRSVFVTERKVLHKSTDVKVLHKSTDVRENAPQKHRAPRFIRVYALTQKKKLSGNFPVPRPETLGKPQKPSPESFFFSIEDRKLFSVPEKFPVSRPREFTLQVDISKKRLCPSAPCASMLHFQHNRNVEALYTTFLQLIE